MACRFMSMISNDGMRALPLLEIAIKTSADLALALIMFTLLGLWSVPAWLVVVIAALGGALLGVL